MKEVLVYLFTGFLESGKTTFIQDTLTQKQFNEGEKTVLLIFEDGFTDYDEKNLQENWNTVLVHLNDISSLSTHYLESIQKTYQPERVMIEYNGMWPVSQLVNMPLPSSWQLVQVVTTIQAPTFASYINNMRSLVYEHVVYSDLIIFNRYQEDMKKSFFRNNIKAINPRAQIIYELENGLLDNRPEEVPYDLSLDHLTILDHDYGVFCMDILERPHLYEGKTITIKGKMIGLDKKIPNGFILGRTAMVCCEQDTSLVGLVCLSELAQQIIPEEWIKVEGKIYLTYDDDMQQDMPILHVQQLSICDALTDEYVYFT